MIGASERLETFEEPVHRVFRPDEQGTRLTGARVACNQAGEGHCRGDGDGTTGDIHIDQSEHAV